MKRPVFSRTWQSGSHCKEKCSSRRPRAAGKRKRNSEETAVYQPMKRAQMGWKRPWPVGAAYRGVGQFAIILHKEEL